MKAEYLDIVRKWVSEGHGSVLFSDLENVPHDVRARTLTVTAGNALEIARLVSHAATVFVYDPERHLDAAVRDKMLCL